MSGYPPPGYGDPSNGIEPSGLRMSLEVTEKVCSSHPMFAPKPCGHRLVRVQMSSELASVAAAARVEVKDGDTVCLGIWQCQLSTAAKLKRLVELLK